MPDTEGLSPSSRAMGMMATLMFTLSCRRAGECVCVCVRGGRLTLGSRHTPRCARSPRRKLSLKVGTRHVADDEAEGGGAEELVAGGQRVPPRQRVHHGFCARGRHPGALHQRRLAVQAVQHAAPCAALRPVFGGDAGSDSSALDTRGPARKEPRPGGAIGLPGPQRRGSRWVSRSSLRRSVRGALLRGQVHLARGHRGTAPWLGLVLRCPMLVRVCVLVAVCALSRLLEVLVLRISPDAAQARAGRTRSRTRAARKHASTPAPQKALAPDQ